MSKHIGHLVTCILISAAILGGCKTKNTDKLIPVVGELDSLDVAGDTVRQLGIEQSYEYAQTINLGNHTAYDILAYGGPASYGKFHIIKRTTNNSEDTLVTADRNGVITGFLSADLNNNGKTELYVIIAQPATFKLQQILGYEDAGKTTHEIKTDAAVYSTATTGKDSFYVSGNNLVRSNSSANQQPVYYYLNNNILVPGNKKNTATN